MEGTLPIKLLHTDINSIYGITSNAELNDIDCPSSCLQKSYGLEFNQARD
jgi:hypothetical protein